jgi:hypothetical protein
MFRSSISFSILVFGLLFSVNGHAQYVLDEYYNQKDMLYEDHVYKEGIKTVRLHPINDEMAMPIINLNGGVLRLSFDDLYADFMNLSYTIIHCNADWTPSGLLTQEYIANLQDGYIQNYEYSLNTLFSYTHYNLDIPNGNMRLLKSGNYIVKVYASNDPTDLVLTKRFMVYEDIVTAGGQVYRPTVVDYFNTGQEVRFTISHPNYEIPNPFTDLKVHVMQNQRWDNAITNLKPQFLQNNQLVYNYNRETTFSGDNEFRFFDIKNMRTLTLNMRRVDIDSVFTVYLKDDASREIVRYSTYPDINGQFVVRRLDATNSASEADYVYVDFQLRYPEPLSEGDVYVFGKFSDWKLLPEYRLTYDRYRKAYHSKLLLKQGYYNFMYAVYDGNNKAADVTKVEGSHWETENTYQILVYNREIGQRYDRLIGFGEISSADLY